MTSQLLERNRDDMPKADGDAGVRIAVRESGDWELPEHNLPVAKAYGNDPRWLPVLKDGLQQRPIRLEALVPVADGTQGERLAGVLPLAFVKSRLFGRFLVSLPYLNTAGVVAESDKVATRLVDRAVELADELDVRYLELRQEAATSHPALTFQRTDKVHMRLELPESVEALRDGLKAKVRNQVKKGESYELDVSWGRYDLLPEFYDVFCRNMRDLGTPVYGRRLFEAMLQSFGDDAEFCVIRNEGRAIAAGLLIHGDGVTQVPSASSLRGFNHLNANMLMYWNLLSRAVERGSRSFDFGRSSEGSGTHRFKKQWGAQEFPSIWQYYVRKGDADAMRPDSATNQRLIRIWQRLPVWLTRLIGPRIVRGIP